ncbi:hypothetical protein SDC9_148915 [bioreactor metagenome]|uniref:Uncharacterized protein n=1 Tax=bioreactor metagenome TaxID=1076179 RepID=A0A645EM17_9ZZZZ
MITVSPCERQLIIFLVINFQNTAVFHKYRGRSFGGDLYGFSRFGINRHTPLPHGLGIAGNGLGFHELIFSGIEIAKVDFTVRAADPGTDNGLPAGFNLVILLVVMRMLFITAIQHKGDAFQGLLSFRVQLLKVKGNFFRFIGFRNGHHIPDAVDGKVKLCLIQLIALWRGNFFKVVVSKN